jgi:glycosyltransferase involved in cell wall biosynthesis
MKLSICIPVYNGEKFIAKTIQSILAQLNQFNQYSIEILIIDNNSQDMTFKIMEQYKEKNQSIKCLKNNVNLGYDKNIDLLVEKATGEYVWFLGCGEVIKDGVIDLVLAEITRENFDNILLNFDIYSEKIKKMDTNNNFNISNNVIFTTKEEFWDKTFTGCTTLSSNIVLRKAYLEIMNHKLQEIGWCHFERVIDICARNEYNKSLLISTICFTLNRETDGWWTQNGNLLLNSYTLVKIINSMGQRGYSKDTMKKLKSATPIKDFAYYIIVAKKQGLKFNIKISHDLFSLFNKKIGFYLILLPLIILPNVIIERIISIKETFKRLNIYHKNA